MVRIAYCILCAMKNATRLHMIARHNTLTNNANYKVNRSLNEYVSIYLMCLHKHDDKRLQAKLRES